MTTSLVTLNANLTGTTITATSQFSGPGTGLTNIPFTGLTAGTANQVVINNGSGFITSEAQLSTSRGGTGINTSASTGVAKVSAGTWSVATIVDADINASAAITRSKLASGTASHVIINDGSGVLSSEAQLSNTRGGTGLNTSASTGVAKVSSGTWSVATIVDADINASAAITRTKIASGTANHVVINNGSGVLSSEAQLANTRGGTGLDSSVSTGVAKVATGTWSVATIVNADVNASAAIARSKLASGTGFAFVVNDTSGVMTSSAGVLTDASDNVIIQSKKLYLDTSTNTMLAVATVSTSNATATSLISVSCTVSTGYLLYFDIIANDTTDTATGSFSGYVKVYQGSSLAAPPTATSIINLISILDSAVSTTAVTVLTSNGAFAIQVAGVAAKTINWRASYRFTSY